MQMLGWKLKVGVDLGLGALTWTLELQAGIRGESRGMRLMTKGSVLEHHDQQFSFQPVKTHESWMSR